MVLLRKCCCFSVETGTKIIGMLTLLNVAFGLIITSISLSNLNSREDDIRHDIRKLITENIPVTEDNHSNYGEMVKYLTNVIITTTRQVCIVAILNALVTLSAVALLFIGILKKKSVYLLPYLIIDGLSLIGVGIGSLCIIILLFAGIGTIPIGIILLVIIIVLLLNCLFIYMWIVVYSHYCVLKEENARGQYDKQVYRSA